MSPLNPILTPEQIAKALCGYVDQEGRIRAPGPGHSRDDHSLTVWVDPTDPAGFKVETFSSTDTWMGCRDYVCERLGLGPCGMDNRRTRRAAQAEGVPRRRVSAEYVYRRADGTPFLKVTRLERPKTFRQSRWTGSAWANGKPEGGKLPYRLPELMADRERPVFVCEGEKDADRLTDLGFLATSASEGAGKWTADLAQWFDGRQVFILPDNDGPGEKHAEQVARSLHGVAKEVRIVRLPGLPEKGDVSDWLDAGDEPDKLLTLASAAPLWDATESANDLRKIEFTEEAEASGVPFLTGAELLRRPLKPRRFLAGQVMPLGQVTDFRGDGKTGKSTLGIQLCVAAVIGRPWLDMPVVRGPAVYLASEDDVDEVHRRIDAIATHYRVPNESLSDLHVWPLAEDDPALVVLEHGKLTPTARWWALVAKVEAVRPVVVVLDSRADVFAGEEMNRQQVRTFVGMLRALAVNTGACVVLLSHPSLSGMADRTGNSGSTHWTNAVRSVLYLHRPEGEGADPEARELTFGPSNYAAGGAAPLRLRWSVGAFVVEGGPVRSVGRQEAEAEADRVFLNLLAKMTARCVRVHATTGHGYAPKVFERDPGAAGIKARGFEAAMHRLFDAEKIRVVEEGPPSKRTKYLAAVEG